MNRSALTTASFFFSFGWARFMGTGFFGMGKKRDEMNGQARVGAASYLYACRGAH